MQPWQPDPVLIRLGPIAIYWYGVLIVSGAMLAAHIASKLSSANGHDPEIAWNLLLIVLIAGVIGRARSTTSSTSGAYYRLHPGEILGLQMSGFGIYGAVLGRRPGRVGLCQVPQAALPGMDGLCCARPHPGPGHRSLGQLFQPGALRLSHRIFPGASTSPRSIACPATRRSTASIPRFSTSRFFVLSGFAVLLYLARTWRKDRLYGDIFFLYGLIYPTIRFFTEFQRPDAWKIGGIPTAQWISIISVVFFGSLLLIRRKLRRPSMIYVPGTPWQPPEEHPAAANEATATAPSGGREASTETLPPRQIAKSDPLRKTRSVEPRFPTSRPRAPARGSAWQPGRLYRDSPRVHRGDPRLGFRGRLLETAHRSLDQGGIVRSLVRQGGWGVSTFNSLDKLDAPVDQAYDARAWCRASPSSWPTYPLSRDEIRVPLADRLSRAALE